MNIIQVEEVSHYMLGLRMLYMQCGVSICCESSFGRIVQ